LFVAREIALAHGGGISATSSAEHGTVFTVSLPRVPLD
jgi:signal transduction histidine kinase